MKKKLLALCLSATMILSLITPAAFAEEPEGECCGACGQVVSECICEITDESTPCEVCGEVECVCEDVVELPEEEVPGAGTPEETPEEPTACEVCGEVECVCEEIEEPEVPEEQPANDYAELYEALMNCESVEEMDALLEELSEEEVAEFFASLTEEEFVALDDLMIELETVEEAGEIIYGDIVYVDNGIVDVTEAAPFLDPVEGAAPRMRMMMAAAGSRAAADDPLKLSKRVSAPDQNGKYTLTLEAYATGSVTVNTETETVPTDIILVLDQSGSMEESMGNYQAYRGASGPASTIYSEHRNDLYAKVGNDYKKVTITTTASATYNTVASLNNNRKNNYYMEQYADNGELFYLHTDGKYYPVTVTTSWGSSTYRYATNPSSIWTGSSNEWNGTPPSINKLYYATTNVTGYTFSYEGADGTTVTETYNASGANSTVAAEKYYYQYTASQSRLDALTAAVTNFAEAVAEKAAGPDKDITTEEDNVNHRIAMVGFASDYRNDSYDNQYTRYCNTEVFVGSNQYLYNDGATNNASDADSAQSHYDEAFQSMDTPDGIDNIEDSIDVLAAKGGTFINLGIEMANGIFSENPITEPKRNRVVVVFTDGEPGWSGFNTTPANNAIAQANIAKNTYGATVYTVGVFTDANASIPVLNTALDANKFMHYVSSNFKNATSMSNTGDPTYPTTGSYYLSASNSDALNDIFETISNNIVSGKTDVTLDEKAVVQDVVSPYFKLPNGTDEDDIKVYTADYIDVDTFDEREEYEQAKISVSGKTVQVSNFSFKDNFVGEEKTNGVVTDYVGKKLIIEIPIIVEPQFLGGDDVITNGDRSGIYEDVNAAKEGASVGDFTSPVTDVTIKTATIRAEDKNVYLSQTLEESDLKSGAEIVFKYTNEDGTPGELALEKVDWQDDYVITTTAGSSEGSLSNMTADAEYTVSCTLTSTTDATNKTTGYGSADIKVFKPYVTVTATDIWADYKQSVALDTWGLEEGNLEILWQHKDTEGNLTTADKAGLKAEDAPTVVPAEFKFAQVVGDVETACENEYVTNELDTDFNVKGLTCTVGGSVSYETKLGETLLVTKAVPAEKHDFTIHINHFTMTITKSVGDSKEIYHQDFIFDVVSETGEKFQVVIHGKGEKTIKGLVCGKTYDVYENGEWSWRYSADGNDNFQDITIANSLRNDVPEMKNAPVAFKNKQNIFTWLSGNDFLNNRKKRGEV